MSAKIAFLLIVLSLVSVFSTACNSVKIVLPDNGCNVAACTSAQKNGGVYINGTNYAPAK